MNTKKVSSPVLISGAISLVLLTASTSSYAEESKEQCAGVVKAGLNDCASSEHGCAGLNTDDGYENDWLWVPTGTCSKIKGAHVIGVKKSQINNNELNPKEELKPLRESMEKQK